MKRTERVGRLAAGFALAATFGFLAMAHAETPRVIKLKATDTMKFDVTRITARAGELLQVELTTASSVSKEQMAHNFVLLAKDTQADSFVMAASMARDSGYIPPSQKQYILAHTELAGGGETAKVTFNAPKEPGEYLYICTFPGHYLAGMKGTLVVK